MEKVVLEFQGVYRFLSNFYPAVVQFEGMTYPSAEHAYQASKAPDENRRRLIAACPTPGQAKRAGRLVHMSPTWHARRLDIMLEIARSKFAVQPLQDMLLATDEAELQEGNAWGDYFWGICPPGSGDGLNHLGKILMQVRKEIADVRTKGT